MQIRHINVLKLLDKLTGKVKVQCQRHHSQQMQSVLYESQTNHNIMKIKICDEHIQYLFLCSCYDYEYKIVQ